MNCLDIKSTEFSCETHFSSSFRCKSSSTSDVTSESLIFQQIISMAESNNSEIVLNLFGDITQLIIDVFIILLCTLYIVLILLNQHFRQAKLMWPTINICLATIFFSLNQLFLLSIRLQGSKSSIISCRLHSFFVDLSACQMMYAHSVSAVNRFLAIQYFHKPLFRSTRWLLISIVTGWFVALLVSIPYLLYDGFSCAISSRDELLTVYTCITTLVLPVAIVGLCNLFVFSSIRRSSRRVHQHDQAEATGQVNPLTKRDLHLSKIMLITFCIFILGWAPLFLEQLVVDIERQVPLIITVLFRINLSVCLLCGMTLLIYFNQQIRQYIAKLCHCDRIVVLRIFATYAS